MLYHHHTTVLCSFMHSLCIVFYHYLLFDESDQHSLSNQTIGSDHSIVPSEKNSSEVVDDCHHDFVMKDDLGIVCRVCGLIQQRIENIFELQWKKVCSIQSKLVQFTFLNTL